MAAQVLNKTHQFDAFIDPDGEVVFLSTDAAREEEAEKERWYFHSFFLFKFPGAFLVVVMRIDKPANFGYECPRDIRAAFVL
jgi:hypothetical protein